MNGVQAMKRIPRIRFPQRHPKPSGSASQSQAVSMNSETDMRTFFSGSNAPRTVGGKLLCSPSVHLSLTKKSRRYCWVAASERVTGL